MNALVRGGAEDQEWAVKDLYAMLLHSSSTHASQEWGAFPWSTRTHSGHNLQPDVPSSSKTIELIRNMLVREYKNDLYLFSAVSPEWFQPGKTLEAINEPTEFGPVSVHSRINSKFDDWGWVVKLSNKFWQPPAHVVIRIPWFYEVQAVEADGRPAQVKDGQLVLPAGTQEVKVRGRIKPGMPEMSFERTAEDYRQEYRKRYEEFLRTGVTQP
jgi:hypothetical protein